MALAPVPPRRGQAAEGGAGSNATPAGVFVIKSGSLTWPPAPDVTRIVLGGQLVAVVLALVARSVLRRR